MTQARGTFKVTMEPQPPYDSGEGATLARVSLTKDFQGDLLGSSSAEMLSAVTNVNGSAGYVAIERVTATLHGRAGTFVLQHSGTMTRGAPNLTITIVPDSGTGALTGIAGTLAIDILEGAHHYTLDYALD